MAATCTSLQSPPPAVLKPHIQTNADPSANAKAGGWAAF
jgi:hypothetical protein